MRRLFAIGAVPLLVVAAWFGNVGAAILFGACVYAVLDTPTSTRTCSATGCDRTVQARGLCQTHYQRARKRPTFKPWGGTLEERFVSKVKQGEGCWIWQGTVQSEGYGVFAAEGRRMSAHRFAYELWVGPIPEGLVIDHVKARGCATTLCVNPAHLEPVTPGENTLRGSGPSAVNAVKTHCPQGHPYDEANTHIAKTGKRSCRTCHREREAAIRQGRFYRPAPVERPRRLGPLR